MICCHVEGGRDKRFKDDLRHFFAITVKYTRSRVPWRRSCTCLQTRAVEFRFSMEINSIGLRGAFVMSGGCFSGTCQTSKSTGRRHPVTAMGSQLQSKHNQFLRYKTDYCYKRAAFLWKLQQLTRATRTASRAHRSTWRSTPKHVQTSSTTWQLDYYRLRLIVRCFFSSSL